MVDLARQLPENKQVEVGGKSIFSALFIALFIVVVIVLFNYYQFLKKEKKYVNLTSQYEALTNKSERLVKENPILLGGVDIEQMIKKKKDKVTGLRAKLHELEGGGEQLEISYYFKLLARVTPKGISLRSINIDLAKKELALSGDSINKKLVANYIELLNRSLNFYGKQLDAFSVFSGTDNRFDFQLATSNKYLKTIEIKQQSKYSRRGPLVRVKKDISSKSTSGQSDNQVKKLTEMKNYYITEQDKMKKVIRGYRP